ncbi:hypothetical protein [Cellulomonas sp. PhB143]|uniref:hypothetical protein n=1 Tax=Cellulomonas sp. PhB143 TaxID=2485186 RepID=UPI0011CE1ECA|nr:hypothetical protein [Cellulomonas sp. PhB143]
MTEESADPHATDPHADDTRADDTHAVRPRRLLLHGLGLSVRGNAQAFGYSVTVTATFGAVAVRLGDPTSLQIMGFALCAVLAFSLLNVLVALQIRRDPSEAVPEPARVLLIATASDLLAVAAAVGSAIGVTAWLAGGVAWFVAPLCSGLVYVVVQSAELAVGLARAQAQ